MSNDDSPGALFKGQHNSLPVTLPPGPPWRRFGDERPKRPPYVVRPQDIDIVNTSLHLRRPLMVTGYPGVGKSSLAYAVAEDLGLGDVLHWPVNSRSVLSDALYRYDAVARLRDATLYQHRNAAPPPVEEYITLGPLGTALAAPPGRPRVLLIDELDKGDIDLPNDLLTVFEDGAFEIPELSRHSSATGLQHTRVGLTRTTRWHPPGKGDSTGLPDGERGREDEALGDVSGGWVHCREFPVVIITSNGERDFPPAFLRRCVRLFLDDPDQDHLTSVVEAQFARELGAADEQTTAAVQQLIATFSQAGQDGRLATDQLLNAIHLRLSHVALDPHVLEAVLRPLDDADTLP
ncbi:AAA family ATPase [Streptomyces avermitilis]|uniref:AAA family ATPase n=1 Tax=Streptomyces avermitilis TaxID=33903 RepID=UPI0036A682F6